MRTYAKDKTMRIRSKDEDRELTSLLGKYDSLIKKKASKCRRALGAGMRLLSQEDLYQAGVIGLVEAYDTYDDSLGVPLQAYIALRVTYSMYSEITQATPVSRYFLSLLRDFEKDVTVLQHIYKRSPTEEDLADFLLMTPEELFKHIKRLNPTSLPVIEIQYSQTGAEQEDVVSVEELASDGEIIERLKKLFPSLTAREQKLVQHIFFEGASLSETGRIFGVSKQRVAILRNRLLNKLRKELGE